LTSFIKYDIIKTKKGGGKMAKVKKGYEVLVANLPNCDFCGKTASYDGQTIFGAWAYMCKECFNRYGVGLGVGYGQKLILKK